MIASSPVTLPASDRVELTARYMQAVVLLERFHEKTETSSRNKVRQPPEYLPDYDCNQLDSLHKFCGIDNFTSEEPAPLCVEIPLRPDNYQITDRVEKCLEKGQKDPDLPCCRMIRSCEPKSEDVNDFFTDHRYAKQGEVIRTILLEASRRSESPDNQSHGKVLDSYIKSTNVMFWQFCEDNQI